MLLYYSMEWGEKLVTVVRMLESFEKVERKILGKFFRGGPQPRKVLRPGGHQFPVIDAFLAAGGSALIVLGQVMAAALAHVEPAHGHQCGDQRENNQRCVGAR